VKKILLFLAIIAISTASLTAGQDTKYFTRIIHATDGGLTLELPVYIYLRIVTFTQTGGFGGTAFGSVIVYQDGNAADGANVLFANATPLSTASSPDVIIAGPATVFIAPVPNATLLVTYQLGYN